MPTHLLTYHTTQQNKRRKQDGKSSQIKRQMRTLLTSCCHGQNSLHIRKIDLLPIKMDPVSGKQKEKTPKQPSSPIFQTQHYSFTAAPSTFCLHSQSRMEVVGNLVQGRSSTGHCSYQERSVPAWAFNRPQLIQEMPLCSNMEVFHELQSGYLMSREIPPVLALTFPVLFLAHCSLFLSPFCAFCCSLNTFSQTCHTWLIGLTVVGLFWSWLKSVMSVVGQS